MKATQPFPWWVAVPVAVLLALGLAGLRLPDAPMPKPSNQSASSLRLVAEEGTAALDPTPLFMPRPERGGKAGLRTEALGLGAEFPPLFEARASPDLRSVPGAPAASADPIAGLVLTERSDVPLAMGRADGAVARLPARLAGIEIVEARTGRVVLRRELPPTDESEAPKSGWQPLELRGMVGPAGLDGGLTINRSSGSAETDQYFRRRLMNSERVGEQLEPGAYIYRVGP